MWRGPMLHKALEQFLVDVHWGEPDFLVLDLPPGTGDVAMSIAQFVPRAEVLVVTTPQAAAERVAQRAAVLARQLRLPVRGVVENQSWFTGDDGKRYELFGHGGGELLAKSLGVALLAQIPFLPSLRQGGDVGVPSRPSTPTARRAGLRLPRRAGGGARTRAACTGPSSRLADLRRTGVRHPARSVDAVEAASLSVMSEQSRRWASTMSGHPSDVRGIRTAASSRRCTSPAARRVSSTARRERPRRSGCWRRARPGRSGRAAARSRSRRSVADLLRARPGPDPALDGLPASGRQDPGLHLPRRPPADPAHPRARGGAGRERDLARLPVERRLDRGDRPRPRLRPRPGRPRQRGGTVAVPRRGLRPRGMGRRRHGRCR